MHDISRYIVPLENRVLRSFVRVKKVPDKERIDLLQYSSVLSPEALYIVDSANLDASSDAVREASEVSIFVACPDGVVPVVFFGPSVNLVFVHMELGELYTVLNRVMNAYHRASVFFFKAKSVRMNVPELISSASTAMSVGIFVMNAGYQLTNGAIPDSFFDKYAKEMKDTGCLSGQSIQQLFGDEHETLRLSYREDGVNYLACKIEAPKPINMVIIIDADSPYDAEFLMHLLADYFTAVFDSVSAHEGRGSGKVLTLGDILSDNTLPEEWVRSSLNIPPERNYYYALLVADFQPVTNDTQKYAQLSRVFSEAFPGIRSTVYDGCVVGVLPMGMMSPSAKTRTNLLENLFGEGWDMDKLNAALAELGAFACLLAAVRHFGVMRDRYQMARDVLAMATKLPATRNSRIYRFEEYQLYLNIKYGLDYFFHRYPTRAILMLIFPDIVTLRKYDVSNNKDYCRVLYHFLLSGRDAAKTAAELFMHRNTVYNKIKAIEAMLDVKLDDPVVHTSYLMSLMLVRYCEKILGIDLNSMLMN